MYNTGNPIGSTAPKDFSDNSEITDRYVNDVVNETTQDRFGRSRLTLHGIEKKADTVFASVGFFPPVDYTTGLNVNSRNFTVTYNGVVYAAQPSAVPFTTAAWDAAQWYPIQNVLNQKNLLVFDTYAEASAAAATLPDGQKLLAEEQQYNVQSGAIVEDADPFISAALVGFKLDDLSAAARTAAGKLGDLVHVRDFGAIGVGDDADKIQAAIKKAYESGAAALLFDPNIQHQISKAVFFNSYGVLPRGIQVLGMNMLLTAPTAGGAVVNVGRGADVGQGAAIERTGRITIVNPQIDGGSIAGENGFGFARNASVLVLNPVVRNCKRDYVGTREGGRAFTSHSRCRGVYVLNPTIINCSDAIHHSPAPDYSASATKITTITGITKGAQTTFEVASNTFNVGDVVYTYGVGGMTQVNPSYSFSPRFTVTAVAGNSVTVDLDSSGFSDYTSGGNILLADLTDEGRSPGVFYSGVYAEDCEYTLVNVETANWPRNLNVMPTLFINGITAKNCGTTATRGLISASQGSVQIDGIAVYNDAAHPVQSLIRGSFQFSRITGVFDIHTLQRVVDADPTVENPSGTGIDAGVGTHPFGTSLDNDYNITLIYRGAQSAITSLVHATDITGAVDRFYRNTINITVSGLPDGTNFTRPLNNIAFHYTNLFHITDRGSSREYVGVMTVANAALPTANNSRFLSGGTVMQEFAKVQESASRTASLVALDAAGAVSGQLRFQGSNNRWYFGMAGTDYWQFTQTNLVPNADNAYDAGSAGLRLRTIHAGTGSINTSDEREKQQWRDQSEAEKGAALEIKQSIKAFKFSDAVNAKGESARWHFGVGAQTVGEILLSHGLNPESYAFWCYDEWGEQPEIKDDAGNVTQEFIAAGGRYGIRYDELAMFILAAI